MFSLTILRNKSWGPRLLVQISVSLLMTPGLQLQGFESPNLIILCVSVSWCAYAKALAYPTLTECNWASLIFLILVKVMSSWLHISSVSLLYFTLWSKLTFGQIFWHGPVHGTSFRIIYIALGTNIYRHIWKPVWYSGKLNDNLNFHEQNVIFSKSFNAIL